jgi:hypothetical protein
MPFCLLIVFAAFAGGCSADGSASQDPNAPIKIETTQMYVTVRNDSGLALNEVSVAIVPVGRSTIFNRFIGRLESAESRNLMLGEFVGRDGAPFSLRAVKPRSVEVKGHDVKGSPRRAVISSVAPWLPGAELDAG